MWEQFFTFLNTGRYNFYEILSLTRGRRCSGLIRHGILYDYRPIQSPQGDNATALAKFALSECFLLPMLQFFQ